jgi:hypothetical protein
MEILDTQLKPFYEALEITVGYLVQAGYGVSEANDAASKHILPIFYLGERRALMLANRAISSIEKERAVEDERRSSILNELFRELA